MNNIKDYTNRLLERITNGRVQAEFSENVSYEGKCLVLKNLDTGRSNKMSPKMIRQGVYMALKPTKKNTHQVGWGLDRMYDFSRIAKEVKDEFFSNCSFNHNAVGKKSARKKQDTKTLEVVKGLPSIPGLNVDGPYNILGKQGGEEREYYLVRSNEETTPLVKLAMTKSAYMSYFERRKESLSKSTKYDKNGYLRFKPELPSPNNPYRNCARIKFDAERRLVHDICVRLERHCKNAVAISQFPMPGRKGGLMYGDLYFEVNGAKYLVEVNGKDFHSDEDGGTDAAKKAFCKSNGITYLSYVPVKNAKRDGETDMLMWLEANFWPSLYRDKNNH